MPTQKPVRSDRGAAFTFEMLKQFRLVWLLLKDGRVSFLTKLILPLSLLYLISPIDIIPAALFPIFGGLDDLGVILLGMALFVKMAPSHIVQSYQNELEYGDLYNDDQTIDTTYRMIDEE
jgi:uncharacterized membrane protein YkvA (DUF1232 family)